MAVYESIMGHTGETGPDEIAPCVGSRPEDKRAEREHEAMRMRVGALPIGTRISFVRPGGEGRREGEIIRQPKAYSYHVQVDDGKGDPHLGDPGLAVVLWASHEVLVLALPKKQVATKGTKGTKSTKGPNAQRPTPNAQRPTPNAQRPTPNAQRPTSNGRQDRRCRR